MTDGILRTIEEWTGARPNGCPWRAFSDPFVRRVMDAYPFFDKGQLTVFDQDPSNRLVDGVAFYQRATHIVEWRRAERERDERDRQRLAAEASRGR